MKPMVVAACTLALAICTARSDNLRTEFGFQTQSCGKWTELRHELLPGGLIGAERASIEFWALGFVSGNNWGADKDYFDGVDPSAVFVWLDNYCQAHPFEKFSDAITLLIRERKRANH